MRFSVLFSVFLSIFLLKGGGTQPLFIDTNTDMPGGTRAPANNSGDGDGDNDMNRQKRRLHKKNKSEKLND